MFSCLRPASPHVVEIKTKYNGELQPTCAPLIEKIRKAMATSHQDLGQMVANHINATVQMYETDDNDPIQSLVYLHRDRYVQVIVACDDDQIMYEFAQEGYLWFYTHPPAEKCHPMKLPSTAEHSSRSTAKEENG